MKQAQDLTTLQDRAREVAKKIGIAPEDLEVFADFVAAKVIERLAENPAQPGNILLMLFRAGGPASRLLRGGDGGNYIQP